MGCALNPLLTLANQTLRRQRPPLPANFTSGLWTDPAGPHRYAYVYFRTRGCSFSHAGQCTMCDYWAAEPPTPEAMVTAVREALAKLPDTIEVLQINGLGSLFDGKEVPAPVRREILKMVAARDVGLFIVETRPETITDTVLDELATYLPGRRLGVELGLESSSPWVQRFCLNKTSAKTIEQAMARARRAGIATYVNVLLGSPFLTAAEAEADAVESVRAALALGADACILFPAHVKPHTLMHWLWQRGEYQCPSLWSLVRVLERLGEDRARTIISWYRPQYTAEETSMGKGSAAVPDSCPQCREAVLEKLDAYRDSEDVAIIDALASFACACRTAPTTAAAPPPLAERIQQAYDRVGKELLPPGSWPRLKAQALAGLDEVPEHLLVVEAR